MADFSEDYLTDLPNLIGFIKDMSTFPAEGGALIGIDLSRFGRVNETHGEEAGHRIIRTLAHALRTVTAPVRERARPYRLGGDEFAIVYHGADFDAASEIAELVATRFREDLGAASLPEAPFIHCVILYPSEASTLSSMLIALHIQLGEIREGGGRKRPPAWIENLFGHLIHQFEETIDELERTQKLAVTDAISGLPNHRAAEAALARAIAQCANEKRVFSLLFVDGDKLKDYNETFGYEVGNNMIRQLGQTLSEHIRPDDQVFRWLSGDEFLVILPGASRDAATRVAERLRKAVAEAFAERCIAITVSVGVATYPDDGTDADRLIREVSLANARAKQAGKNRTFGV